MTVRNLNHLCKPGSVALIGASDEPRSVGAVLARNLRDGGFAGRIMPVNPHQPAIDGEPCLPRRSRACRDARPRGGRDAARDACPASSPTLGARGTARRS